ncbi:hypothetical protein BH23BAC3_BH23BAC3_36430 [soil metagenome]
MKKAILRKEVERLLEDLPEDANWNDLMYKIYVRQSIEQGLEDSQKDRLKPHEDIRKKYQLAE